MIHLHRRETASNNRAENAFVGPRGGLSGQGRLNEPQGFWDGVHRFPHCYLLVAGVQPGQLIKGLDG